MTPDWAMVRERARLADTLVVTITSLTAVACIIPLYADLSWLPAAVVMVLLVAALGAVARAIALPIPLIPVLQVVGVAVATTVMVSREEAWGGWFPTEASWGVVRDLARTGLLDAEAFSAPVPALPGLVLLGVVSAGIIAMALDTLIVSVRAPLIGGLVVLGLYAGCAALQFGRAPWWTFPVAAGGWLLALAADQRDRLREWADLPRTQPVRGLSRSARRIGLASIAVALVAGILLPVRDTTVVPGSGTGGDGAGGGQAAGQEVLLDPLVSMRRNLTLATDTEVLTYQTTADRPTYLRVTALETFDGDAWRQRPGLESGRDPGWEIPGVVAAPGDADVAAYDIAVSSLANTFLPLPYPVAAIDDVAGLREDWRIDASTGVAFSEDSSATGLRYSATAIDPDVSPRELRSAPEPEGALWPQLNLPGGIPEIVEQTAREVTAGAATDYDSALALQDFFTSTGGFEYSTSVRSGASGDYLAEFLVDRVGYCEQFAGAMAVMARQLGIPSRVVVGFTQGSRAADGTWSVTVRDAHAWPELWFEGVGWVRFEPTPRAGATVQAPQYAPAGPQADENRGVLEEEGFTPVDVAPAEEPWSPAPLLMVVVVLALLGALALPAVLRIWHRRRRLRGPGYGAVVEGAWAEIGATAVDVGQPWSPLATPRQAAERLSRGMPDGPADALRRVRAEVERVRYGAPPTHGWGQTPEQAAAVRADVRTVARSLTQRVPRSRRVKAYCWPSSERRRQRSSIRSMNPEDFGGRGAAAGAAELSGSGARTRNAE